MPFDATTVLENVSFILPEMVLLVATLLVIVFDLFLTRKESYQSGILAFVGLACALCGLLLYRTEGPAVEAFSGMLLLDNLSYFFRVFFLVSTIAVVVMSLMCKDLLDHYRCGEYFVLLMTATLGMMLLAAATDFLMLVLALETLSLASFVLVGYYKKDRSSSEAALKYVLFGAVASAIMFYGISFLYGLTGTLNIADVFSVAMAKQSSNFNTVLVALILIMVGVGFKIAAVPFHFWVPDVYQGAPTPITAWLSVASKAAGFAILFRLFGPLLPLGSLDNPHWGLKSLEQMAAHLRLGHFFWLLSAATMFFGNLIALRQTNVKRLLAYSSIAHVGYLLMGLTVMSAEAVSAMLFYFTAYYLMNLGAFLVVILIENHTGRSDFEGFRGFCYKSPLLGVMMGIFMFALTGLPPTAGFIAKFRLFGVVVEAGQHAATFEAAVWLYALVVIAVVNSAISLIYYARVVKTMVFDPPADAAPVKVAFLPAVALLAFAVPLLYFGIFFGGLLNITYLALTK